MKIFSTLHESPMKYITLLFLVNKILDFLKTKVKWVVVIGNYCSLYICSIYIADYRTGIKNEHTYAI